MEKVVPDRKDQSARATLGEPPFLFPLIPKSGQHQISPCSITAL